MKRVKRNKRRVYVKSMNKNKEEGRATRDSTTSCDGKNNWMFDLWYTCGEMGNALSLGIGVVLRMHISAC